MNEPDAMTDWIAIPFEELSAEALRGLIEEFVSRQGTDYGLSEKTMEEKVADVMRQLRTGEAVISYDPQAETTNIVSSREV